MRQAVNPGEEVFGRLPFLGLMESIIQSAWLSDVLVQGDAGAVDDTQCQEASGEVGHQARAI
jgi:hypothetical protein